MGNGGSGGTRPGSSSASSARSATTARRSRPAGKSRGTGRTGSWTSTSPIPRSPDGGPGPVEQPAGFSPLRGWSRRWGRRRGGRLPRGGADAGGATGFGGQVQLLREAGPARAVPGRQQRGGGVWRQVRQRHSDLRRVPDGVRGDPGRDGLVVSRGRLCRRAGGC